jgi:hypothetical protein
MIVMPPFNHSNIETTSLDGWKWSRRSIERCFRSFTPSPYVLTARFHRMRIHSMGAWTLAVINCASGSWKTTPTLPASYPGSA